LNKKNLFILRSPLQIINAIELIGHFKLTNNIVILIFNSLDNNTQQIEELMAQAKWEKVIRLESTKKSKLLQYVKLIRKLQKDEYKYLIIGNYGTIQKIMIPNLSKEKVFYIDDGTETIATYNNYIKKNKLNKYDFRELRFLAFGLKVRIKDKINLFTYFDLESVNGIEVIKNNLLFLKKNNLSKLERTNDIYFIGQPLDDVQVLEIEDYVNVLEAISRFYNKKIIYTPHRSESKNLQKSIDSIDSNLLEVIKPNIPIELYFLKQNIYPRMIVSYFSTALSTLKIIYDEIDIKVIKIPYEKIKNKKYYNDFLEDYYKKVKPDSIIMFKELKL